MDALGLNVYVNSPCALGCLTCTSPSTNCQTCDISNNYYLSGSECLLCPSGNQVSDTGDSCVACGTIDGWYMNGDTCELCEGVGLFWSAPNCLHTTTVLGETFYLMRRNAQPDAYHPSTDNALGTEAAYGTYSNDPQGTETFGIPYD